MTTKVLTGTYTSGYPIQSGITVLSIAVSGYVEGNGVKGDSSADTIANGGRINSTGAGVYLDHGGVVTNGSDSDETALIEGAGNGVSIRSVDGTVINYGTVISTYVNSSFVSGAIYTVGGPVTNGSLLDTSARAEGKYGVADEQTSGEATISNYGTLQGTSSGVLVNGSAEITNGAATETSARIEGGTLAGIFTEGKSVIENYGTVEGLKSDGVYTRAGGQITNGVPGDTSALIEGDSGVHVSTSGSATVTNFGSIIGAGSAFRASGIYLGDGGSITNGSADDHSALISGYGGVIAFSPTTVVNYGSIQATSAQRGFPHYGLTLYGGGSMTNGSANDRTALISGFGGFSSLGSGSSSNFGTIQGAGAGADAYGVSLWGGGTFTNGSANDQTALIEGYVGAGVPSGVLVNFGTILGVSGTAVELENPGQELVVEAKSVFDGSVDGDGGTLDLASGTGTISGLFAGGEVTVSGSMPTTTFDNFDEVDIETGASFTLTGTDTIGAGQGIFDNGTLNVTGAFTSSGFLTGGGTVDFTAGTDHLSAATISVNDLNVTGATVTLSGKIAVTAVVVASGKLLVSSGTSLTGAGAIVFTDSAVNEITGTSSTSLLTNDTRLEGEGQVGDGAMELTNAASGTIISLGPGSLTLNTGTNTILNAGAMESEGTGGLTISSPIDNTGKLFAVFSPLTVTGAVTGAGIGELESTGSLILKGAFDENVTFVAGATGALELGDSKGFTTGAITGFSKTGANALDLLDIPFVSGTTKATYSGTTTSGVLTVKDGSNVATIHLTGNYTTSTFTVSAGPGGVGTKVVDPGKATAPHLIPPAPLSPHPFIAAMASFGAPAAGAVALDGAVWRAPPLPSTLVMPRDQMA